MTDHKVVTREEWLAARQELLEREKELTRKGDELARHRRELPWVPVEKEYRFETEEGTKTLAELFDGRSQLAIYHFMFGPTYKAGCPACSSIADSFNGVLAHLKARDVTMMCISRGPLEKILAYRERMGWSMPWASSAGNDFNFDFGYSLPAEALEGAPFLQGEPPPPLGELAHMTGTTVAGYVAEQPGMSSFVLDDGSIYHTYSCTARGGEFLMGYYPILDRVPYGRNEGSPPEFWLRRHDEYAD